MRFKITSNQIGGHEVAWVPWMQVPVIIGGPGLPEGTKFNSSVKDPGLANLASTSN